MPQKKPAKRAKMKRPAAKRQTQNSILALAEKVEKEFRQIPAKLAKLYRQELMAQKKQESKLKAEIKTLQKKQLTAKKPNQQAAKKINLLTTKLHQITKNNAMLLTKQHKYTALNKELAKLEKQFTLKAVTMTKAKPTAKQTKSTKPKQVKLTEQQSALEKTLNEETPFMISSKNDLVEA